MLGLLMLRTRRSRPSWKSECARSLPRGCVPRIVNGFKISHIVESAKWALTHPSTPLIVPLFSLVCLRFNSHSFPFAPPRSLLASTSLLPAVDRYRSRRFPFSHPFASSLSGSDNILSISSERYKSAPLIIQGSGAGAEVTAMGVTVSIRRRRPHAESNEPKNG